MEAIECPYCGEENHTSSPEALAECAYCERRFAQVSTPNQTLVILDRDQKSPWRIAEELMARWMESGELEKEAVVDRRYGEGRHFGPDRRRYDLSAAA
jgi:hypothetical protein